MNTISLDIIADHLEVTVPAEHIDEFLIMVARAGNTWQDRSPEMYLFTGACRRLQDARQEQKELEVKSN